MVITKDDKKLYEFLDIAYMLFGKSAGRKVLFGDGENLLFYCEGYAGRFYQDDFSFDEACYSLGKTPEANYVIEPKRELETLEIASSEKIDELLCRYSTRLEIASRVENYKIAKIVADTNFWLKDDDLKILAKYRFFTVKVPLLEDNMLIVSEENNAYSSNIIFNFDCTYTKPVTQLSFDTVENDDDEEQKELNTIEEEAQLDKLMHDTLDELGDDYDPMA